MAPKVQAEEMPGRVAVLYASFHDHTRLIAVHIAATLAASGFQVETHNVRSVLAFDPHGYAAAVLAAPVHLGRHHADMVAFVKKNRAALEQLPTAFVSVTLSEAGVEQSFVSSEQRRQSTADVRMMLQRFLAETGWEPTRMKAVAGAITYTSYNFLVRFGIKQIAKKVGAGTDTSRDYDYTDWDALDVFVKGFAEEIRSAPAVEEDDPIVV